MKLAELVLIGTVTDIQERTGTNDRGPWRMVTAYLAGARQVYQVTLNDKTEPFVQRGESVALVVYARPYNNRVDFNALDIWDGDLDTSGASRAA